MYRPAALSLLLASACFPVAPPDAPAATRAEAPKPVDIPLHWQGELSLGNGESLRFFVAFARDGEKWDALLDIPEQGAYDAEVGALEVGPDKISFALESVDARWRWNPTAKEHACKFEQRGVALACEVEVITTADYETATALRRPQTPQGPFPYAAEEVVVENLAADVRLAGTLTIPAGPGPHPAAVLLTGSGPQDRDETVFGHKPFLVLADHLSRNGIAVLRLDDRGVGGSTGSPATATSMDFAGDALAAVAFLRGRPEVDKAEVGLIGHSEGALVAPLVAARPENQIAWLVLLAGPGVPGRDLVMRQAQLLAERSGAEQAVVEQDARDRKRIFDTLLKSDDPKAAEPALRAILREQLQALGLEGDALEKATMAQIEAVNSPWFRFFLTHDPALVLRKLKTVPILALVGSLDLQVDPEQNLPAIKAALAKNRRAKVEQLEGLNHLFQHAQTGLVTEYARIEETFAPDALARVSAFVLEHTKD